MINFSMPQISEADYSEYKNAYYDEAAKVFAFPTINGTHFIDVGSIVELDPISLDRMRNLTSFVIYFRTVRCEIFLTRYGKEASGTEMKLFNTLVRVWIEEKSKRNGAGAE